MRKGRRDIQRKKREREYINKNGKERAIPTSLYVKKPIKEIVFFTSFSEYRDSWSKVIFFFPDFLRLFPKACQNDPQC